MTHPRPDYQTVPGTFRVDQPGMLEMAEGVAYAVFFCSDATRPPGLTPVHRGRAVITEQEIRASHGNEREILAVVERALRSAYSAAVPAAHGIRFRIATRGPLRLRRAAS